MASSKAGQLLTDDEVREYAAYHNNQITPPAKFDRVVVESTLPSGPVYRWATDEEVKEGEAVTAAAVQAADDAAKLVEKVRAEASKRGVEVPVPPPPPPAGR